MKFVWSAALTAIWLVLLAAVYLAHIWFFEVPVVLYAALLDGLIAAVIAIILLWALGSRVPLDGLHKSMLLSLWVLGSFTFAITVPTVLDRSLSFYLLEKLQQRGGGIREDAFAQVFTTEYMKEFRLVDVRLTEQQQSGTITIENGCVHITARGNALATFSRFYRMNLLPKRRLLMGEYTDVLVDPFRDSPTGKLGYEC